MNILLWVLQIVLAVLYVAGGAFKIAKTEEVMKFKVGLPPAAWRVLGVIEVLGGILLVLPARVTGMPTLITIGAVVLTLETLFLAAMYARKSVKLVAANPFVWAAAMGLLVAFVAYGRSTLA